MGVGVFPDPTLMSATQAAATVVAEGGDTDEVKVQHVDPGKEIELALFL